MIGILAALVRPANEPRFQFEQFGAAVLEESSLTIRPKRWITPKGQSFIEAGSIVEASSHTALAEIATSHGINLSIFGSAVLEGELADDSAKTVVGSRQMTII